MCTFLSFVPTNRVHILTVCVFLFVVVVYTEIDEEGLKIKVCARARVCAFMEHVLQTSCICPSGLFTGLQVCRRRAEATLIGCVGACKLPS